MKKQDKVRVLAGFSEFDNFKLNGRTRVKVDEISDLRTTDDKSPLCAYTYIECDIQIEDLLGSASAGTKGDRWSGITLYDCKETQ